ncbi:response regulator [Ferruginivarius sediminum]|uniref:Regulatory protein VirG n=1 Tax=Ferruginivarius sediminum TaxID=2661937 RepID=A0A369T772_9PROT|nr:response regulator [Ferruginivarius sediminum]RDD60314.1 response regulator [Ferruginivarius sediminum]
MQYVRTGSRILLVDDDPRLCRFLNRFLTGEGFAIETAHDGHQMRRALANGQFDLIILDVMFPRGEDGLSLVRTLRSDSVTPVIVLSGKTTAVDKIIGLELGADDYLSKPFEPRELLARIRALLRRSEGPFSRAEGGAAGNGDGEVVEFGGWRLDLERQELRSPDDERVELTSHEFKLLKALVERPGRVMSRDRILDMTANRLWNPDDRSVDVSIAKLRRKLGDDPRHACLIKTVRGVGYVFTPPGHGS